MTGWVGSQIYLGGREGGREAGRGLSIHQQAGHEPDMTSKSPGGELNYFSVKTRRLKQFLWLLSGAEGSLAQIPPTAQYEVRGLQVP